MNATTSANTSPEALRDRMITQIKDRGYTLSGRVEQALRTVERHAFVPDAALVDAYASSIVVTKRGPANEVLSCLSEPGIVALQLGQLDVRPGHRVLEIGAGTGYTAALLAQLVGSQGHVTTIDVDGDVVADARRKSRGRVRHGRGGARRRCARPPGWRALRPNRGRSRRVRHPGGLARTTGPGGGW